MIRILLVLAALFLAGCATTEGAEEDTEPTVIDAAPEPVPEPASPAAEPESKQQEGEVPLAVAESEQPEAAPADESIAEVVVQGHIRNRHEAIHDLVTEAQTLLQDMCKLFGSERIMWGSDMPNVERFCTYKQSLDYVRRYCQFLTAREKDLILGDTCTAFYGIRQATAS